jgi:hypothetical protein
MQKPARFLACAALLGLVVHSGKATAQDAAPSKDEFTQKLKEAGDAYYQARAAALKQVEDLQKKNKEAIEKLEKELAAAKDREGRAKLFEEVRKLRSEGIRLHQIHFGIRSSGIHGVGSPSPALPPVREEERLGARLSKPSDLVVAQFALTKGQALVFERVEKDRAAARAGIQAHDILVQVNGKPVPSEMEEFRKLLAAIKPGEAVEAVVVRQGKPQTIQGLKLPELGIRSPEPKAGEVQTPKQPPKEQPSSPPASKPATEPVPKDN